MTKKLVSITLDEEVLAWVDSQGDRSDTINSVLRQWAMLDNEIGEGSLARLILETLRAGLPYKDIVSKDAVSVE